MAESNLKEMMIDDMNETGDEEGHQYDNQPKISWYLMDTDSSFAKVWSFLITLITIYTLFMSPYIYVFNSLYMDEVPVGSNNYIAANKSQKNFVTIEYAIDIIFTIDICLSFLKKTRTHKCL